MNYNTKILTLVLFVFTFAATISFAQEDSSKSHSNHEAKIDMKNDDQKHMDMKDHNSMKMNDGQKEDDSIVRKGIIDLNAIDKNGDGKVYQDIMDWNVISDEPGTCPLCKMKLKEVTISEAKYNLIKNGFDFK